jgi:hypothetical protein
VLAVPEEESILSECVQAGVPRTWLSWHYRSRDESLIAFSNALYYEDRLSTFPAPRATPPGPEDGVGISLVRVAGRFLRSGAGRRLRTNPVEAEAIVADIRRRFAEHPPGPDGSSVPSIGVVTFNAPQRTLVEELLRDCGDPRVAAALEASDGLFVKNLENVQGDERDVILFSTAFSVNDKGMLPLNFGPLNQAGGERRLNVAVTRARRQVIVYSSFDPEQLRAEQTSARGIKDLRTYLDLAAAGTGVLDSLAIRTPRTEPPDRHREEVAAALRARGWSVDELVGLSEFRVDLALRSPNNPERYAVAVLLDGPAWARRRTVGDRDGLPVEVLSGLMQWPGVERVWLPHWVGDPGAVLDSLSYAVQRAEEAWEESSGRTAPPASLGASDRTAPAPGWPESTPGDGADEPAVLGTRRANTDWATTEGAAFGAVSTAATGATHDRATTEGASLGTVSAAATGATLDSADQGPLHRAPAGAVAPGRASEVGEGEGPDPAAPDRVFVPWDLQLLGDRSVLDQLPAWGAATRVRQVIEQIAAAEGPVHTRRLARLTAAAFGLRKVSEERAEAILRLVPNELNDASGEPFVWPPGVDQEGWRTYRRQVSVQERPLEQISLHEIGNAMAGVARAAAGVERESLLRETYAVFGGLRLTEGVRQRLNLAVDGFLASGRLRQSADFILPGDESPSG